MTDRLIIRSRLGYWGTIISIIICIYLFILQAVQGGIYSAIKFSFIPILIIAATITIWFSPRLIVLPAGIELYNPIYIYRLPWADIDTIYNQWGVRITVKNQDIGVWVLPTNRSFFTQSARRETKPNYWNTIFHQIKDKHEIAHELATKRVGVVTLDSLAGGKLLRERKEEYHGLPRAIRKSLRQDFTYRHNWNWINISLWSLALVSFLFRIII